MGRILPFDEPCAYLFAHLSASSEKRGLSIPSHDVQIAAIAVHHHMAVATRDVSDFEHAGLSVINLWTD